MKRIVCFVLAVFVLLSSCCVFSAEEVNTGTPNSDNSIEDGLGDYSGYDYDPNNRPKYDWSGAGVGSSGIPSLALKFYRLAGISPGKYPYYILTYSTADGQYTHENCFFAAYSEEPVFSLSEYNGFYSVYVVGFPTAVFQFFQTDFSPSGSSAWKPVNGMHSTLYIFSGGSSSINTGLNPPMLDVYGSNGSRMNGSTFIYKTNINITLPDGSTFGEPDEPGESYDPDDYGLEKMRMPEFPDLGEYQKKYGVVLGTILWLVDCIKELLSTIVYNIKVFMNNLLKLPNVLLDMLKNLFKKLFVPNQEKLNSHREELTAAFEEKFPLVSSAFGIMDSIFSEATGQTVTASYGSSGVSQDFFYSSGSSGVLYTVGSSTHSSDSGIEHGGGGGSFDFSSAPKFTFTFSSGETAYIDFAPFTPYMFYVRCLVTGFMLFTFIRHLLLALPSIIGRVPK